MLKDIKESGLTLKQALQKTKNDTSLWPILRAGSNRNASLLAKECSRTACDCGDVHTMGEDNQRKAVEKLITRSDVEVGQDWLDRAQAILKLVDAACDRLCHVDMPPEFFE